MAGVRVLSSAGTTPFMRRLSISLRPATLVVSYMRFRAWRAESISAWLAAICSGVVTPVLAEWMANFFMRLRISVTWPIAPSVMAMRLFDSLVFWIARSSPSICERSCSEMMRPAGSSAAVLMRKPLASFSMAFELALLLVCKFLWR